MTDEDRSEIARKAAKSRWATEKSQPAPIKVVSGSIDKPLLIGNVAIECYVLENGDRVITQGSMLEALGRSRRPKVAADDDPSLPPILQMRAIRPYITDETIQNAQPIRFVSKTGSVAHGYKAELLPEVCEAWLQARAAGALTPRQFPTAQAAEIIVRGLARVGIIALVDEATGYQDVRARDALAKILEAYVAKELQPWVRTFDVEFYKEICRLRGVPFDPNSVKYPPYFGHLTNDIVYKRVAPGVFSAIKEQKKKDDRSARAKMHQQLTQEVGHPKLREHLSSVTTVMKLSDDWTDFKKKLDRVHPSYDQHPSQVQLWDENLESGRGL